jgi:purine nucleosidase
MPKKIIFDCDNTMGIRGCDVDDGLALIYLLAKEEVEICGITTTYGNSDINTVYNNTAKMLQDIGRPNIPLLKGCPDRFTLSAEAVDYLIETVNSNKGTSPYWLRDSHHNLFASYQRDNSFLEKVSEIVIMAELQKNL